MKSRLNLLIIFLCISTSGCQQFTAEKSIPDEMSSPSDNSDTPIPDTDAKAAWTSTPTPTFTVTPTPSLVPLVLRNLQVALGGNLDTPTLLAPQDKFPIGTTFIWATFDYTAPPDTEIEWTLYKDSELLDKDTLRLDDIEGTQAIYLRPEQGFGKGDYEFMVVTSSNTSISLSFEVIWLPTVWPISISEDFSFEASMGMESVDSKTEFESGIDQVYAYFPMANIDQGSTITITWLFNNKLYAVHEYEWYSDVSMGMRAEKLSNPEAPNEPLPDGSYAVKIFINGKLARFEEFFIGK